MHGLLYAVGFLTRLPVPVRVFDDSAARSASLAWYPVVGLLLGVLLGALAWAVHTLPPLLSAALLLSAWVALTGALHLDGLADSADAWVGGLGDRERTLQIMRDPRCGPSGVVTLALVLLIKFAALASLPLLASPMQTLPMLLLAPLLARTALVAAFVSMPYVRPGGLGSGLEHASRPACSFGMLSALVVVLLFSGIGGLLAAVVAVVAFWLWHRACVQRLGGMTGDTCGALVELVEAAVLVVVAIRLGVIG